MSISSEHIRRKKTVTDANGNHIPVSEWTDADSVTFENGLQLDELIKPILKADYEALSDEEKNNGTLYFIPDDDASASTINYDNSASELSSTDMQGAVDELAKPSYSESSTLTKLTSGEKITTAFGKLAKAVSSLISHLADNVLHITSAERTKWNGYESTISTNTTNIANNATAISSLNSDLSYQHMMDVLNFSSENLLLASAYAEQGNIIMTISVPHSVTGVLTASFDNTYAPKTEVFGIPNYGNSSSDTGKIAMASIGDGYVNIWVREALKGVEQVQFVYPLKHGLFK